MTLRERVAELRRKYKHVNPFKFFYNKAGELKARYKRIRVWYLIHDKDIGYSVMRMDYKRLMTMNVSKWTELHRTKVGEYNSLYSIFTQAVLPAINNKGGNQWRFKSLIGWAGLSDSRSAKDSAASRRRHKTSKKGNANARRVNRGRHRNKRR